MRSLLLKTDGTVQEVSPKGKDWKIQEFYDLIGCSTVEHLDLVNGVHMWCDEEGRLIDEPVRNDAATKYFLKAFPLDSHIFPGGVTDIVGNVVIVDNTKAGWL